MKHVIRLYVGLLVAAFMLFGVAANPAIAQEKAKDAKAAPATKAEKGGVIQTLLAQDDKFAVWETRLKPGDENLSVPTSSFRVARALKGGTLMRTYADRKTENVEWKTGQVRIQGPSGQFTTKNVGKTEVVLYTVVVKEPKK